MPNNTTVNKVIINGVTRLDLTGDTATPSDVAQGKTFHDAAGILQTGTASGGGGDSWSWMGKNPIKIATPLDEKVFLKDTAFATWTPSTTATTLVASTNLSAQTIDLASYDYVIHVLFHTHFNYGTGRTGKNYIINYYATYGHILYSRCGNTLNSLRNNTPNTATSMNIPIYYGLIYKNSQGAEALYSSGAYGVYNSSTPASVTLSATSVTIKTPQIQARCNSSYFSTANCSAVNQDTSYYESKIELWRVDFQTSLCGGACTKTLHDMWLKGGII